MGRVIVQDTGAIVNEGDGGRSKLLTTQAPKPPKAVEHLTVGLPGSISCIGPSQDRTFTVTIAPDAPPGPIVFSLIGSVGGEPWCSTNVVVTVDECVDLTFDTVSDADEANPGGFICLNDDDDNGGGNGTPDLSDPGPTAGENDLRPLTVSLGGGWTGAGTVTLTCEAGCAKIKRYENPDRSMPVTLPQSWTVPTTELPKTFYVEGIAVSASTRDVEFKALYTGNGGPCEDRVKLTVIDVDIIVGGVNELAEEVPPGLKVATNNDFDEGATDAAGDPVADYSDLSPVTADGAGQLITCPRGLWTPDR